MMTDTLNPEFVEGMRRLIQQMVTSLAAGERFDNPKFTALADDAFGGTRTQGVYTCRDAYDALEAAVNRFLLEGKAQDFMQAGADAFPALRALIEQLPTQTDRTAEQTELQQFSTPPTIAFLAAKVLGARPEDTVLEPSAGTGSLAIWPHALGLRVVCNEISQRRRTLLETLGFESYNLDAEIIHDVLPDLVQPTAVLMNPPFSATAGRVEQHHSRYGLLHVESALRRLEEGGRLVAILGESVSFHRPAMTPWWENLMAEYTVRANLGIDGREYAKYGTANDVQLIVIDKIGPTTGKGWKSKLNSIIWGSTECVEEASSRLEKLPPRANRQPVSASAAGTKAHTPLFVPYVPAKLTGGSPHPAVIVESTSMAAVVPPDITYRPRLPVEIVKEGKLSIIQLERVIYAGQRHEQRLPDGSRAGFYVGDGTGVGKGRVLAAIILDNWFQNRRRAIWFSVNNDLLDSTRRDLRDLGVDVPLAKINDDPAAGDISLRCGVIFSSYGSLIATAKNGARRLDQIQRWLGPDGVIIFDEAHKAKNALAGGRGEPTLTGQAVIDLQDATRNPDYRVVYSSATGATDVRNMAYMTRLGLWGKGTSFPDGFKDFMEDIDNGGVGAMEMVSRDMKSLGMYLSGSISFGVCPTSGKAVEYREVIHRLTDEQRSMYNHASQAWKVVLQNIEKALDITNASSRARGRALTKFWGDHQRFFRQIICSFKVPTVIAEAEAALAQEKSIVTSLVGTGEARTKDQIAKAIAEGGSLEDLDFSPREIIGKLIERGFPTALYRDETDPVSKKIIKVLVTDKEGHPIQSKEALKLRQRLLDGLSALHLPENPLDQLVNHFGEFNVSEITGRSRRLIRDKRTGETHYKKRAPEGVAMNRVNVHGMEQFQAGNTRVAIISDAGSIGISLHASNRAPNRQRRVHITHELGWSADKQMQCFGRTHRSDQAIPPEYVLLSTELGGEKRFSSTIARRLGSLGALTKGDRGAADNADWARYNFETEQGKAALSLLFRRITTEGAPVPGLLDPKQTLRDIGLLVCRDGREEVRDEDLRNVPRFLNRILALGVEDQNALFDYFAELFDQTVSYAKANGTFDAGVTDIRALAIRIAKEPRVVHMDRVTGAETILYPLQVDRWSNRF
ncbi:MAG TPA: strawberry notch family protein [Candidatus Angelobacter sp.]|nr:strawberry notch family protein [Candidatus Angelobacter sp.]